MQKIKTINEKVKVQTGISMYYFFISIPLSIMGGFMPVYMREIGFSDTQVGVVVGIAALTGMVCTAIWGAIDDKFQRSSKLLLITALMAGVGVFFMGMVKTFALFLLARVIYDMFMCGSWPITDKTAMQAQEHYKAPYANMRVWGSVGFSIILVPVMFLVDKFNSNAIAFAIALIGIGLAVLSTFLFKDIDNRTQAILTTEDNDEKKVKKPDNAIKTLLTTKPYILLMLTFMFMYSSNEVAGSFQGIHLTQTLGAPSIAISLATLIAAGISEVPLFIISTKLNQKFGWYFSILIAAVCFLLRFTYEGQITSWHWFLAGKMIHGICMGLSTSAFFVLVKKHVDAKVYSRAVTLLTSIRCLLTTVLSMGVGSLIDYTGTTFSMYYVFMLALALAIVVFLYYGYKYERPRKKMAELREARDLRK